MENKKGLDFVEYFESGEEEPELIEEDSTHINEGLVDVIFKTFKTNMKVNVSGQLIYFKWEWILNKTFFTIRVRRKTLDNFVKWLQDIQGYADSE